MDQQFAAASLREQFPLSGAMKRAGPEGVFAGYASLFGKVDLGRDLVLPGAFRDSLLKKGAKGIKLLFQHNPDEPIGVWDELREDARGLFVRGRLLPEVAKARDVLHLMREGALDGLSIGFRTLKGRTNPRSGIRQLASIDLWEISVVTFPMLNEARVAFVKSEAGQGPPTHPPGYRRPPSDPGRDPNQRLAAEMRRAASYLRGGSRPHLPERQSCE
jgi:HK97 family phage prohead protease